MDNRAVILRALRDLGIPYALHEHAPMWTIDDCLALPGLGLGATVPRNVFLCNRQQTAYYLFLSSPRRAFRTAVVSKLLGVSRLSFAPADRLPSLLGLQPGAVSPLGLLFDLEKQVELVVDDALLRHERLWFHPGVNTASVEMATGDFLGRFLPGIGRTARSIRLPDEEDSGQTPPG